MKNIAILVMLGLIVSGCNDEVSEASINETSVSLNSSVTSEANQLENTKLENASDIISITPNELIAAYKDDPQKANKTYKGKIIKLEELVVNIDYNIQDKSYLTPVPTVQPKPHTVIASDGVDNKLSLEQLLSSKNAKNYFNCSFKSKKASKKCLVTVSPVSSSIHSTIKEFYGPKQTMQLLTIHWPDGDTSKYVEMDSYEFLNLKTNNSYQFANGFSDINLKNGLLLVDSNNKEHIRIW